jgi:type II secretory pathway component HofQ
MMLGALSYPAKAQQSPDANASASSPRTKLLLKLKSISLSVNFDKMDIASVLDFLSKKSKELDPEKQGINFVLQLPDDAAKNSDSTAPRTKTHREVSMTLDNIPLFDLLQEISEQTNLQVSVEDYAVVLHPLTAPTH